jgi:hypothetical protein
MDEKLYIENLNKCNEKESKHLSNHRKKAFRKCSIFVFFNRTIKKSFRKKI